MMTLEEC